MKRAALALLLCSMGCATVAPVQSTELMACPAPTGQAQGCDVPPCAYPTDPGVWLPKQLADHYVCSMKCCKETQAELTKQPAKIDWIGLATIAVITAGAVVVAVKK